MSVESNRSVNEGEKEEHTWIEQIEIAASELVDRTKELIEEGNVRRLIIRNQDDDVLLEVPLTTGVAVGGVVTLIAPVLTALGAMAAAATCRGRLIHNAAHDLGFWAQLGYEQEGELIDAMLLSQLLYAGAAVPPLKKGRTSHALDTVADASLTSC